MLYRIFTEDKGDAERMDVIKLVSGVFEGFTVLKGAGVWRGSLEASLIVEIEAPAVKSSLVALLAEDIRRALCQEAVMVQSLMSQVQFVEEGVI